MDTALNDSSWNGKMKKKEVQLKKDTEKTFTSDAPLL
jgi:hypothetical protein